MRVVFLSYLCAHLFWFALFSPWGPDVNFWVMMLVATSVLAGCALYEGRQEFRPILRFRVTWILTGAGSAVVLYAAFVVGNLFLNGLFGSGREQVARIYELKAQAPTAWIAASLVWIAAAEEVFWRGLVQRRLVERFGAWQGYLGASLMYAAVHVWAFNQTLLGAALVCGLFWGWMMLKYRSLWPGIISHVLWDVAIFVCFPIRT